MKGFWDFAIESPFFAFLIIAASIYVPCHYGFNAFNRWIRHKNIKDKGWPPPYLDADGDNQATIAEEETEEITD